MVLEIMDLHNSRVEPELNRSFCRPKGWIFKISPCISARLKNFLSFSPQTFITVLSLPHQKPLWHTTHKGSLLLFLSAMLQLWEPPESGQADKGDQGALLCSAFLPKISLMPQTEICCREVTPEATHLLGNPSCSIITKYRASMP